MAYRVRQIVLVKYGHFGEYLKTVKQLEEVVRKRGWAPGRVLVPTAGLNNQIIVETEYPDLASMQSEIDAFYGDTEAFEAFRAGAPFIVEGSSHTEILEDMPMDFPGSD